MKRIGVLFVCLGNICRSPAAEGAFTHLVKEKELESFFKIDSCGTAGYHIGELPHDTTRKVAKERGIELKHRCRQFTYQDFKNFDYILVMDESNLRNVLALAKTEEEKNKVFKFRKFDHTVGGAPDVPDPYYGGVAGFEHVQDIVTRCSAGLLSFLQEEFPHAKIPDSENQDWMKEDELIMYDEEKEEQENDF